LELEKVLYDGDCDSDTDTTDYDRWIIIVDVKDNSKSGKKKLLTELNRCEQADNPSKQFHAGKSANTPGEETLTRRRYADLVNGVRHVQGHEIE
jgi:hypothetical protein